jgi:hypothetical protein
MKPIFTRRATPDSCSPASRRLWRQVPRYKPLSVGVVLLDLVPADHQPPDLFAADKPENCRR